MSELTAYIKQGVNARILKQEDLPGGLVAIRFKNIRKPSLIGSLIMNTNGECMYVELNGLTNKTYARGEGLTQEEIVGFVEATINDEIDEKTNILGKKILQYKNTKISLGKQV